MSPQGAGPAVPRCSGREDRTRGCTGGTGHRGFGGSQTNGVRPGPSPVGCRGGDDRGRALGVLPGAAGEGREGWRGAFHDPRHSRRKVAPRVLAGRIHAGLRHRRFRRLALVRTGPRFLRISTDRDYRPSGSGDLFFAGQPVDRIQWSLPAGQGAGDGWRAVPDSGHGVGACRGRLGSGW